MAGLFKSSALASLSAVGGKRSRYARTNYPHVECPVEGDGNCQSTPLRRVSHEPSSQCRGWARGRHSRSAAYAEYNFALNSGGGFRREPD